MKVLTPKGQVESFGQFTRALGRRRVKIALFVLGLFALIPAVVAAFFGESGGHRGAMGPCWSSIGRRMPRR